MNAITRSRCIVPCLTFYALFIAGQTAQAQWSQLQGNAAHSGYVAETVSGNSLAKGWDKTFLYNGQTTTHSDIAINAQGIYLDYYQGPDGSGGSLYNVVSLNRANSQEQWNAGVSSRAGQVSAPSVSGGIVYAHSYGHSGISGGNPSQYPHLVGINAATGQTVFFR